MESAHINLVINVTIRAELIYDKSFRFGLRDGSLDNNPKINNELKKITHVYTKIFKAIIALISLGYVK